MKTDPVETNCTKRVGRSTVGKRFTGRAGVSVIETATVMVLIVVCLVIVLSSTTGAIDRSLARIGEALTGQKTSHVAALDSGDHAHYAESGFEQLLRLGIFTCTVVVFLAYTVFFMSKSEMGTGQATGVLESKAEQRPKPRSFVASLMDKRSRIGRVLREEMCEFDSDHLIVAKFMTANPTLANIDEDVNEVMNLMVTKGFRHLIIVDDQEQIRGIISDRDLVNVTGKPIADIMTPDPYQVEATTPVSIAITMLVKNRISALPVLHEEKVVGILTRSDLLVTLQCLLLNVQEEIAAGKQTRTELQSV